MSEKEFLKQAKKLIAKRGVKLEKDHEEAYCDYAKSKKCLPLKLILLNLRGFPDRTTLCPNARVLFIEFKRGTNKLTPNQSDWKERIERFGFTHAVCYTFEEAKQVLDDFLFFDEEW